MASIKHVFVFEYSTVCANIHQISNLKYQGASLMKAFELPANGRAQAEEMLKSSTSSSSTTTTTTTTSTTTTTTSSPLVTVSTLKPLWLNLHVFLFVPKKFLN